MQVHVRCGIPDSNSLLQLKRDTIGLALVAGDMKSPKFDLPVSKCQSNINLKVSRPICHYSSCQLHFNLKVPEVRRRCHDASSVDIRNLTSTNCRLNTDPHESTLDQCYSIQLRSRRAAGLPSSSSNPSVFYFTSHHYLVDRALGSRRVSMLCS
jgi:hypothetical protein